MMALINKIERPKKKAWWDLAYFAIGACLGLILLVASLMWISREAILPNVLIANQAVGGMNVYEARTQLHKLIDSQDLSITFNGARWILPRKIAFIDIYGAVDKAQTVGKTWDLPVITKLVTGKVEIPLTVSLDDSEYASWAAQIEEATTIVAQPAKLTYDGKNLNLINGEDGISPDIIKLKSQIVNQLSELVYQDLEVPTLVQPAALTESERQKVLTIGEALVGDQLAITIVDEKVVLTTKELLSFISLDPRGVGEISQKTIEDYVRGLAERYNTQPQDAKFEFADGRVREFAPGKDGITVDVQNSVEALNKAMDLLIHDSTKEATTLTVIRKAPTVTTESVNDMGIVERIGRGESYYAHSIANRVYNVGLASSRVNGALVAPGEEFSFNKFVGEISGATGYKTAYVISGGRTVLGDGGGVCQVSTTLFRAVMNAGLPITERWGHAYRVGYYEQNSDPGIDATVYSPSKDFKFVNDTPGHILVQVVNDPKTLHLVFEIYGTKDGRVASVSKPKVSGITPPPPDLYEEDPNLPAGMVKQVDWAAWGAKTSFDYKVVKADGAPLFEKTYVTNYRPWQNVYIRGTGGETQ